MIYCQPLGGSQWFMKLLPQNGHPVFSLFSSSSSAFSFTPGGDISLTFPWWSGSSSQSCHQRNHHGQYQRVDWRRISQNSKNSNAISKYWQHLVQRGKDQSPPSDQKIWWLKNSPIPYCKFILILTMRHDRLQSICFDASYISDISSVIPFPVIPNERCGSWYVHE